MNRYRRHALILLSIPLLAAGVRVRAQEATKEELNHDFVFDLSGLAKQVIYDRSLRWISNNLRSPKAVIQSEDPESGTIVANGVTTMTAEGDSAAASLSFRLSVDVREGKERVRFLNLQVSLKPEEGWDEIPSDGAWHRGAQKRFVAMAHSMRDYVKMKPGP